MLFIIPLFNKKVVYKEHPKVGIYGFYIFSKELVEFFSKLGIMHGTKINISIPQYILSNKKFSKRFLRGLFDTDGNVYFDKNRSAKNPINNRPVIKYATVSKKLIDQVFKLLLDFNLHPRMKKPYRGKKDKNMCYTLLIYRKNDIKYFMENIGFKNPKHSTKWEVFKKTGFCPPHTRLAYRKSLLHGKSL